MGIQTRYGKQSDIELFEAAKESLADLRDKSDGSLPEKELHKAVRQRVAESFNVEASIEAQTKKIMKDSQRPGKTKLDGLQLMFPGFEPVDHEPERMINDEEGRMVEDDNANPHFVMAALAKEEKNKIKVVKSFDRSEAVANAYVLWVADNMHLPASERTKGAFLKIKGYLRPI